MSVVLPKTPKRYDSDIVEACKHISPSPPEDVRIAPEPYSKDAQCWFNVWDKVARDGGEPAYGWLLTVYKDKWIKAIPHAVWKSPTGSLLDITPPQLPSMHPERVVFLRDDSLLPFFVNVQKGSPRPTERLFPFQARRLWQFAANKCREVDSLRLAKKQEEAAIELTTLERVLNSEMRGIRQNLPESVL